MLAPPLGAFDARSSTGAVVLEDSGRVAVSSNWRCRAADVAVADDAPVSAAAVEAAEAAAPAPPTPPMSAAPTGGASGSALGSPPTAAATLDAWCANPLRYADSRAFANIGFEAGIHSWDIRVGDKSQSGSSRVIVGAATKARSGADERVWVVDTLTGAIHVVDLGAASRCVHNGAEARSGRAAGAARLPPVSVLYVPLRFVRILLTI